MSQWKRSAECRLCLCPVADTGVQMDALDVEKLSEWWLQKLDVPLDPEDIAQQWICQFCLSDAKLEHQYAEKALSVPVTSCDWWTGWDCNEFDQNYFQVELIQRCSIVAEALLTPTSDTRLAQGISKRISGVPTTCIYCNKLFPSKSKAFQHAANDHKDIETFRCSICQIYVKNKTILEKHKENFHKFACLYCSRYLRDEIAYQNHLNSMHANEVIECKLCDKRFVYFKTQVAHEMHVAQKHFGKFKCIYCKDDNHFRYIASLNAHIRSKHKNEYIKCSNTRCAIFFKTEADRIDHDNSVHASRAEEVKCVICTVKVERPHLQTHMQQFHNCNRKEIVKSVKTTCCYCQRMFPSKAAVMRHVIKIHSNTNTFLCQHCSLCFETLELKQEHYQKAHRAKYTCLYCNGWSCTANSNLRRHLREKHQGEVIQCKYSNMCTLYFKTQSELQKHILESHESGLKNKSRCVYCKKNMSKDSILGHVNIHHKSVSIRCSFSLLCRNYFLTHEDREKHILEVHLTGKVPKSLKCPCCEKEFERFYLLRKHALKIHGETVLKCSFRGCTSFMCSTLEKLNQHVQEQHVEVEKMKLFSCKICDFQTKYRSTIYNHTLRRHGKEKLECKLCSERKVFKSALSLNSHIAQVHLQNHKVANCIYCNVTVPVPQFSTHVTQRPCVHCKVVFSCIGLLRKHRLTCETKYEFCK